MNKKWVIWKNDISPKYHDLVAFLKSKSQVCQIQESFAGDFNMVDNKGYFKELPNPTMTHLSGLDKRASAKDFMPSVIITVTKKKELILFTAQFLC